LSAELAIECGERLGCEVVQGYGMTELSPVSHATPSGMFKPGSVGVTVPNTEVNIVDPFTQSLLGVGEDGEVWVRGPQVMKGYWNNESATKNTIVNVSSNVMGKAGGWWIDDVMIGTLGLGRAALLLGSVGPVEAPAGGTAHIALKLANVGDYETDFRLDAILPAGWDANLEGRSGGLLRGRVVRLGPDNDAALRIAVTVAANATAGTTYPAAISATALADATAGASMTIQVTVSSGFPWEILLAVGLFAAAIVLLAVVVVLRRRRRPGT